MLYDTKKSIKTIETVFDIVYLAIVLFFAIFLLSRDFSFTSPRWVFGLITLLLFLGDTSHLIPRISAMWSKDSKLEPFLGYGKMTTSISMTLFYLGLWYLGIITFEQNGLFATKMTVVFLGFVLVRVVFCVLPQNKWKEDAASFAWGIIRNIPLIIMGLFVILQYIIGGASLPIGNGSSFIWILLIISFAFYIPVLLFANKYPKVGMLMIPKSLAYVAIIFYGSFFFQN